MCCLAALDGAVAKTAPKKMSNDDCLACHSDSSLTKDENGKQVSLHVDDAKFKASIHSAFGCTDCHTDVKAVPARSQRRPSRYAPPATPTSKPLTITASTPKPQPRETPTSPSARIATATCTKSCPRAIPKSKVARTNIPQTCGACHGQKFVMASSGVSSAPFTSYQESVHGKAVAAGSGKAAVCTDCHGEHDILGAGDPKSPINKFNVPATCAKCHDSVKQEYVQSTHGQAIARGNWQRRSAPIATAFTPSRRPTIPIRRWLRPM